MLRDVDDPGRSRRWRCQSGRSGQGGHRRRLPLVGFFPVDELLDGRGLEVDHTTVWRWV